MVQEGEDSFCCSLKHRTFFLQNFPPKTESQCFSFILQGLFRGKCYILRGEKPRRGLNCQITAAVLTSHSAVALEPTGSSQFKGHHNTYLPSSFSRAFGMTTHQPAHNSSHVGSSLLCLQPLFPEFGSCHHLTHSVFISGFKSSVLFSSKNVFFLVICIFCWLLGQEMLLLLASLCGGGGDVCFQASFTNRRDILHRGLSVPTKQHVLTINCSLHFNVSHQRYKWYMCALKVL